MRAKSYPHGVVLRHPHDCPRFGFVPASRHGIRCACDQVSEEAFVAIVFEEIAMEGVSGTMQ